MASWIKCTTEDGIETRVNLDHVAIVRPYHTDRGGKGSEVVFATGTPSSFVVKEDQNSLTMTPPVTAG
jgi:hypothetical protein